MTLLELLVVAGVLSVLLGLGIGFLKQSDGIPEARSALVGQLRLAALDARTRGLPTEVTIAPGEGGTPARVTARGLDPVLLVTFEPGQRFIDGAIAPVFGGAPLPRGRCGQGRVAVEDDKSPALRLVLSPDVVDLREGFAIRCDVKLGHRGAGTLMKLGRCLDVQFDELAQPRVRLVARDAEGRTGTAVNLIAQQSLPVGRWCTFEVGADGRRAWCAVDGQVLAEQGMRDRLQQQQDDVFELLPGGDPVPGAVDELQVFAYMLAPSAALPEGIALDGPVRIAFDVHGEPVAPEDITLRVLASERTEVLQVGSGGVLR